MKRLRASFIRELTNDNDNCKENVTWAKNSRSLKLLSRFNLFSLFYVTGLSWS